MNLKPEEIYALIAFYGEKLSAMNKRSGVTDRDFNDVGYHPRIREYAERVSQLVKELP